MVATTREVAAAVERQLHMTVSAVERQVRWRPTWFVRGERNGAGFDVVVRGDRGDALGFPLRHEFAFHSLLETAGIPVAKLYGWCDDLDAILMEFVPGRPDFAELADVDRDRIVDEYLQALVAVHQLPVEPFLDAGITAPEDGSGMEAMRIQESQWRAAKDWPDPFMEFCLWWLHRHEPDSAGRAAPILCDTGQFHHDGKHLISVLDLEGGHIGDPMMDLAVWRMRDTLIPFGDMDGLYARYEELAGCRVDLDAIERHYFASTIGNELMFGSAVRHPTADTDLMTYMQWNSDTNLMATECLADLLGIDLPEVKIPEPRRSRHAATFDHLVGSLGRLRPADPFLGHEVRLLFRTARHLARVHEIGDSLIGEDLDDIGEILGMRPGTQAEGDEALEDFVLDLVARGDTTHDEDVVRLLHRRNLRVHMQLGPPGSKMVQHYRTQKFRRSDRATRSSSQ
jgi:aminoglycoside phosphotransferase (APT) family kinase protein